MDEEANELVRNISLIQSSRVWVEDVHTGQSTTLNFCEELREK